MDATQLQAIKQRYNIVGNCDALNHVLDVALQVAPTDVSVLIFGESGVGKEIIPRIIHDASPRRREKYFAINCGSIPEGTIDSELFGHVKGSYTGAVNDSPGYFGVADKGTLFLDEVSIFLQRISTARNLRGFDFITLRTQLTKGYDGMQRVTKQDGRIQLESRSGRSWHRLTNVKHEG